MLPPILAVRVFNCDRKRYREIERRSTKISYVIGYLLSLRISYLLSLRMCSSILFYCPM